MTAPPALCVDRLSVEFRTRSGLVRALDDVTFNVRRSETIALVGESGSGKSVTAYAIMGLLDPAGRVTNGQAMFDGIDLLAASPKQLAAVRGRQISMIFQNPRTALNPIRPVGRQIADVLIRHGKVPAREAPQQAVEMLRQDVERERDRADQAEREVEAERQEGRRRIDELQASLVDEAATDRRPLYRARRRPHRGDDQRLRGCGFAYTARAADRPAALVAAVV